MLSLRMQRVIASNLRNYFAHLIGRSLRGDPMSTTMKIQFGLSLLATASICAVSSIAQQTPPAQQQGGRGAEPQQAGRGPGRGGGGRGGQRRNRKVVLAWADTRNGIAQHDS